MGSDGKRLCTTCRHSAPSGSIGPTSRTMTESRCCRTCAENATVFVIFAPGPRGSELRSLL